MVRLGPLSLTVVVALLGGATSMPVLGGTVGEQFRQWIVERDAWCRENKIGPYLDPSDRRSFLQNRRATDCDILRLSPLDWRSEPMVETEGQLYPIPARWVATSEGKFAHSIKLPAPHDQRRPITFSSPGAYFEALCKVEAGEFSFGRVQNVEGIFQDRPPLPYPRGYVSVAFHLREVHGFDRSPHDLLVQPPDGKFKFFEVRLLQEDAQKTGLAFARYFRTSTPTGKEYRTYRDRRAVTVPYVVARELVPSPQAKYGYTWRGIRRPNDWEHGIQGTELIVFQIEPFIVLGVQRGFTRHQPSQGSFNTGATFPQPCPGRLGNQVPMPLTFIKSAVIPASSDSE